MINISFCRAFTVPAALAILLMSTSVSHAIDWNLSGSGSWGTPGNWSPGTVPNAIDAVADISKRDITGNRSINLDGSTFRMGTLIIGDQTNPTNDTTLYGGTIIMDVTTGSALIQILNRNASIVSRVTLNDTTSVNVAGGSTLFTTGNADQNITVFSGAGGLNKTGTGTLILTAANTFTGGFTSTDGVTRAATNTSLGASSGALTLAGGTLASVDSSRRSFSFSSIAMSGDFQLGEASVGTGALTFTSAGSTTISGSTTLNARQDVTINGNITGSGALQKNGVATLRINGNTSFGQIELSIGTLILNGNHSGGRIRTTSGTLVLNGNVEELQVYASSFHLGNSTAPNATATITASSADFGAAILYFNLGANPASGNDRLNVTGAANVDGVIDVRFFAAPTLGTYTLISAASITGSSALAPMPTGTRSTFALSTTATTLDLIVSGASAKALTWTGGSSSDWSTAILGTPKNWQDGTAVAEDFFNLDSVRFDDTATNTNVSITGTVSPSAVVVESNTNNYTFTGAGKISGSTTLLKAGTSTLTISTANDFTGGTTISRGTVRTTTSTGLGSGLVTLGDTNTGSNDVSLLAANANVSNAVNVTSNGSGTATIGSSTEAANSTTTTFSGPITMDRATTLQGGDADGTVFSGQLGGNVGTLTVSGGQRVEFTNGTTVNDFIGNVDITGSGTVLRTNLNTITDTANVNIGTGATWQLNGNEIISALTGSGTLTHFGSARNLTFGAASGAHTFSGNITGNLNLSKLGAGAQTLSGNSNFTGNVNVANGVLILLNNNALGTGNNVTVVGNSTENRNPALVLQGGISTTLNNLTVSGPGNGIYTGVIFNQSGDNTLNVNQIIITGGSGGSTFSSNADLLTINATNGIAANATNRSLTLQGNGNGLINGVIGDGTYTTPTALPLVKNGTGTWTLARANTYTGTTTVNLGNLQVGVGGVGTTGKAATTLVNGGTLSGSGTVTASASSINHLLNGAIRPGDSAGNSIGTLTFEGAATMSSTARTHMQLGAGGSSDRLVGSSTHAGLLTLHGSMAVTFLEYTPQFEDSWTLIDWAGLINMTNFNIGTNYRTGANIGDEGLLDLPDLTLYNPDWLWNIDFNTATGRATISIAPEPGRAMLSILALGCLLLRRNRQKA